MFLLSDSVHCFADVVLRIDGDCLGYIRHEAWKSLDIIILSVGLIIVLAIHTGLRILSTQSKSLSIYNPSRCRFNYTAVLSKLVIITTVTQKSFLKQFK